ncbi:MAG: 23S rRNA (guanosine(2251)-2'-O)-methyltransferase RlmB [Methylococcus sp.]|jgi:23S rRNA (guanosine2251-2'-O)-methyltransferase|nr:MAG: 23S rRNA (guanosine(2251)-2'-O)-methyltransferase RlmB [Methylococcus sp.]
MKARRRVIGLHAAEAALEHGADKILAVWIDSQRNDVRLMALVDRLSALGLKSQPTQRLRLEQMAEGTPHQGVILEVLVADEWGENELRDALESPKGMPFFLVLDHVQDPHNFGACLRTADAAGVHGVIVTKDQSVGITPVVAKVASGAAETMPVYRVTNLARTLKFLKGAGLWVFGAAGEAHKTAYDIDFNVPMALVMGGEGKGLRRLTREHCDGLIKLPMLGTVESLNVSVAAGILMYEVVRQRVVASGS